MEKMGRPQILSADQVNIGFRANRSMESELGRLADEIGVTRSELIRGGIPVMVAFIKKACKEAGEEAKKDFIKTRRVNMAKIRQKVEKYCNEMDQALNKQAYEKIKQGKPSKEE